MDPKAPTSSPNDSSSRTEAPSPPKASVSSQPSAPVPDKPKNRLVKMIVIAAVALIALFGILYFFVFDSSRGAASVGDKFVAAIQKDDPDAAYKLTSDSFKSATQPTEVESIFASISPALQGSTSNNERKIESRNGKTYTAIVYTVNTKESKKYIRVVLEKVGNEWKVTNFRSSASKLEPIIE